MLIYGVQLETIKGSDKIAISHRGRLADFGSPEMLLGSYDTKELLG